MLVIALWLLLVLAVPAAHADARQRSPGGSHVPATRAVRAGGTLGVPAAYAGTWLRPVDGPLLRGFALGSNPYAGGWHRGIDLASARGSPVLSACAGRVTFAGRVPRGGPTVSVRCGAVVATFQQLGSLAVRAGARVMRGARIGMVGASSDPRQRRSHVHLGARDLASGRYLDPLGLLGERPASLPLAPLARRARPRGVPLRPAPRTAPRPVPLGPAPRVVPRAVPIGPAPRFCAGDGASTTRIGRPTAGRPVARLARPRVLRARPARRRVRATSTPPARDGPGRAHRMSSSPTRAHDSHTRLSSMAMPAPQVALDELYRMSTDQYHRLAEAGLAEDFPHCELIDGVLVRKDMKSAEHENAIAWLMRWLMFGVDQARFEVRVGSSLTLTESEPEPDLTVIAREASRPYHPGTAALAIEVSWSSLRRDLNRKAQLYAEAGIDEYWVFDVQARRIVVHRTPSAACYGEVREVRAGERIAGVQAGLPDLEVDELLAATYA